MTPEITEILSSPSINVKNRSEEYTKSYEPEWLTTKREDTVNGNNNNAKVISNNITNYLGFTANEVSFSNKKFNEQEKELFSKEADPKEESFQERFLEERSFTEEAFVEETTSSAGSSSSSFYSAELVQTPHRSLDSSSSTGSSENEMLSPIKPLKAITTTTSTLSRNNDNSCNYNNERLSNIYEILQEIKPDHPLQIQTQFDFTTSNPNPRILSSIIHNPLFHHHRNSSYSPSSLSQTLTNSPRRYSNFQRFTFHNSAPLRRPIISHFEEETDDNFITRQLTDSNNVQEKNVTNDKISYGKIFFWVGFLFMPVWLLGCFYKPTSTEDYKWRRRCRVASTWSIVILSIATIFIVIISQRLKIGL